MKTEWGTQNEARMSVGEELWVERRADTSSGLSAQPLPL